MSQPLLGICKMLSSKTSSRKVGRSLTAFADSLITGYVVEQGIKYIPLTLSAYRRVLRVCSQDMAFGETLAIITVRASSPTKESLSTYIKLTHILSCPSA